MRDSRAHESSPQSNKETSRSEQAREAAIDSVLRLAEDEKKFELIQEAMNGEYSESGSRRSYLTVILARDEQWRELIFGLLKVKPEELSRAIRRLEEK
ncbi:MAG: hypothetical protein JNK05_13260 [Myxococcales bacterium]|nr:hypothetical protein [Myxococcales bacterium]